MCVFRVLSGLKHHLKRALLPGPLEWTAPLVASGPCRRALDIGCGSASVLSHFRPALETTGVDAFAEAIASAKCRNVHDHYVQADILAMPPDERLAFCQGQRFDLVTLFDVIEHFPKRAGYELLERCEALTTKYILVLTPNGYVEQGPEFGNEYQRHRSGWFAHDFEGLGYRVYGCNGTKLFHGYAGQFRFAFPGALLLDTFLAILLRLTSGSRYAYSLIAIKDVRGVPARLGTGKT